MLAEIAGWVGTVLVLVSYALVSMERLRPRTYANQAMNVVGASGLAWNGVVHAAWPLVALDTAWALVGAVAILGISRSVRGG